MFLPLAIAGAGLAGYLYYRQIHEPVPEGEEPDSEESAEGESYTLTAADLRSMSKEDRIAAVLEAARAALSGYDGDKDAAAIMIAAHAARETGWYIHTARTSSSESNNLFGITAKAGEDHVEGNDAGNMRNFKRYTDIAEGIADYVALIERAYKGAYDRLDSQDPRGYAWALKYPRAYYELDFEAFAKPLVSIYSQIEAAA